MRVGDLVAAKELITEEHFTHAVPGDLGMIVDNATGEWPTVQWMRTGSVTDCHRSEFLHRAAATTVYVPLEIAA